MVSRPPSPALPPQTACGKGDASRTFRSAAGRQGAEGCRLRLRGGCSLRHAGHLRVRSRTPDDAARNHRAAGAYGPAHPLSATRDSDPLTHTLRALFAVLASALAFACADAGSGAGHARDVGPGTAREQRQPQAEKAAYSLPSAARVLLRGGGLLLDGPSRRSGAPPRMAAGTDPSHQASFAARVVLRQAIAAHTRRILSLTLARHLAAARDGTLSSRSNGVPPPVFA